MIRTGNAIRTLLGYSVAAAFACCFFFALAWGEDQPVDDATCLGCHEGQDTTLIGTPHRLAGANPKRCEIVVACVDCHSGAQTHLDQPDSTTIGNPRRYSMNRSAQVCGTCHSNPHQVAMVEQNPHALGGLNCTSCHLIHSPGAGSPKAHSSAVCLSCHTEIQAEFTLTSNHRVLEGGVGCVDCHDAAQGLVIPFGDALNRRCLSCHDELEGPYPYEHPATNAYSVEGGGCPECHRSHGSIYDRLLREPPTQLCLQCHVLPEHRTAHGGLFANEDCLSCHTDIHGSFDNARYFPPGVPPSNCFTSGCHPLEED